MLLIDRLMPLGHDEYSDFLMFEKVKRASAIPKSIQAQFWSPLAIPKPLNEIRNNKNN